MDIQTLKYTCKVFAIVSCISCASAFISCTTDKAQEELPQALPDVTAIKERLKAMELAYEYEQFVNKMWQELNLLSDSLTDLRDTREVKSEQNRRTKMASIEKRLKELGNRLKEAEKNNAYNEADKQRISELREAIKRKDKTIKKLKNENTTLRDRNVNLTNLLLQKEIELGEKERLLNIKEYELYSQKKHNSLEIEILGDNLRRIVTNMEGYNGSGIYAPLKQGQIKLVEASIYCYKKGYEIFPNKNILNKIEHTQRGLELYRRSKDLSGLSCY